MRKLTMLMIMVVSLLFTACGGTDDEFYNNDSESGAKVYDMWKYMTPNNSYDVEYDKYENGKKIDYFFEVTKVFQNGVVERTSGNERTTLTLNQNSIKIEESDGSVVQVQRYVKIGDTNVFQSATIKSCIADNFLRSLTIHGSEFYNVIKITCRTEGSSSELYYAYEEGIVSVYRDNGKVKTEIVKVDERRLQ